MSSPIYVVSGLPRSGTSMMMRMLAAGGVPPMTDGVREADDDNPRGFYEYEPAKRLKEDASWLDQAQGKVIKLISELLTALPDAHTYRIVFMRRHLDEVLKSQEKMLIRAGKPAPSEEEQAEMKRFFMLHLGEVEQLLRKSGHIETLFISYNRMLDAPERQVDRVLKFFDEALDRRAMLEVIEPGLYRQRA